MTVWTEVELSQVCELIMGQSPKSMYYNQEQNGIAFLQGCAEFGDTYPKTDTYCSQPNKIAPKDALLFSVRAPVGKMNTADQEYCIGRGLAAIVAKDIDQDYLYYALQTQNHYFSGLAQGSTFTAINSAQLAKLKLNVPEKREDQQMIAKIIVMADSAIAEQQRLLAKQQRIKTGLMQDLLTKGIDEQGNIRSEATHELKDSPLGRIPVEWDVVPLKQVADISSGITLNARNIGDNFIEIPYLRVANVQDGYLDLAEIKTIKVKEGQYDQYLLQHGDVLMNEGGDYDKLGRGCVWRSEIPVCAHQNHVFKVRTYREELDPDFLAYFSASKKGKDYFLLNSKQSTNLASINSTQLKAFPVIKPNIAEQKTIIGKLLNVEHQLEATSNKLKKLSKIKKGLMQDLLSGQNDISQFDLDKLTETLTA